MLLLCRLGNHDKEREKKEINKTAPKFKFKLSEYGHFVTEIYTQNVKKNMLVDVQYHKSNCQIAYQTGVFPRHQHRLRNSYTMVRPPVCGDNPRALASRLSPVQVDNHGITILYHLHQCRPVTL